MTKHESTQAKMCCRDIKEATERILKAREDMRRPLADLVALLKRCTPQTKTEELLFNVVTSSNTALMAFNAELLEDYLTNEELSVEQVMRDAGVNLDMISDEVSA